jgi:hypothetical protein
MGADDTGNICMRGKALSVERAILKMADMIAERCNPEVTKHKTLYITQCQCPDRARFAKDMVMKKTPFKDFLILRAGGISTIYANDGGFVLCF